ncbi:MAG TPA: Rieske (2Fe-2S) protein [Nocardioides sp.]|nr:Rieske (2Fe-2S) protein [Nocardioides sp.]
MTTERIGRRHALAGAAGLGVAVPLLAACGDDGGTSGAPTGDTSGGTTGSDGATGGSASGEIATSDVPVGGGIILDDEKVVVTQPSEGEFKAFSSICTHQGCPVGKVEEGQIVCPCHGSVFSVADGSVLGGPATAPLEEAAVTVEGGRITLG